MKKRRLFRMVIPMYPAFNVYSFIADKTTSLGAVSVATAAREAEGWEVEVIDENNLRRFGPRHADGGADHALIQRLRPADAVGFYGGLTSTIPRLYKVARLYREAGAITIAGGQHFVEETIPEAFSSGIDFVATGEGEETIRELLCALRHGEDPRAVPGIAYRENESVAYSPARPPIQDLDALPLPDFSLLRYANIILYPVGRVRGCGMNCEFCSVKGAPRYASAERLVEQISRVVETTGRRQFFIVDDLFGQDRDETLRMCALLKEYQEHIGKRLRITAQIRLDKARDTALLTAMRQAGVSALAIGFESPIAEELRAMRKALRPEEMIALTRIIHQFGFFIHGMFIFGYPMEDGVRFEMPAAERARRFRSFIRKARIDTIQVVLPVPLPGTQLRERLARRDRIFPREVLGWEYYDAGFPLFEPDPPLTAEEMHRAGLMIMGRFYQGRYLFLFLLNLFTIPYLALHVFDIKSGWRRWYRRWRNYFFRFTGSKVLDKWTSQLQKGRFSNKLREAGRRLRAGQTPPPDCTRASR
ncbi:MAG: radical SAM protein [bacterium]|nr:radical SAM protein [bacterium]